MAEKKNRRALGRGLSSLIPDAEKDGNDGDIENIEIELITTNPFQPRTDFGQEEIQGLAESIKQQGLLQPILVRSTSKGAYEIISGERRFRALKHLGETSAPCIVKDKISDREMLEIALVENIQREDLNEIEKARGYEKLLGECGLSHERLSEQVGMSRSAVTNTLRLLKLPEKIQDMVRHKQLSMGHARALLGINDRARQEKLAERIVSEGLSVRSVENDIQGRGHGRNKKADGDTKSPVDADLKQILEKLQYKLGTSVSVKKRQKGGGQIEIRYYDNNDLNRLIDIFLG